MLRAGHILALCVVALLTLGVVMVNSADMRVRPESPADPSLRDLLVSVLLSRETLYMALAIAGFTITALLPVQALAARLARVGSPASDPTGRRGLLVLAVATGGLVVVLLSVYIPGLDHPVNASHRWIDLRLLGFRTVSAQPSELAKWGILLLLAWYCTSRAGEMRRFLPGLLPGLAASALIAAVIVKEDLGTGALVATSLAFGTYFSASIIDLSPNDLLPLGGYTQRSDKVMEAGG